MQTCNGRNHYHRLFHIPIAWAGDGGCPLCRALVQLRSQESATMDARARVIASERRMGGALVPVVDAARALALAARDVIGSEGWLGHGAKGEGDVIAIPQVSTVDSRALGTLESACEALEEQIGSSAGVES